MAQRGEELDLRAFALDPVGPRGVDDLDGDGSTE